MMSLIVVVGLIVLAAVALRLAVPSLSGDSVATGRVSTDAGTVLGDCPDTPNCQGSESSRSSQKVDRLVVTKPAEQSIASLASIINTMPGSQIISQDDRYLHVTFTTRVMAYVDDVEFLLSDDNQSVQVRSASRLGKSDLGANAKRIASLRTLAEGKI